MSINGEDIAKQFLKHIGEDVSRGGLKETPKRMLKAWSEWFDGYNKDPADVLKTFTDGAEHYGNIDELIIVKNIPFYSHCEHHCAVFYGQATIGYIPNNKIIGLSKFSRIINIFSHRLQVQERLTNQIAECLEKHLEPRGVGVILKAEHTCMTTRGIRTSGSETITSSMKGLFLETNNNARVEFLKLIT